MKGGTNEGERPPALKINRQGQGDGSRAVIRSLRQQWRLLHILRRSFRSRGILRH